MAKVIVDGGSCRFKTVIEIINHESNICSVILQSECPNFTGMDQELKEIDPFKECFSKIGAGQVYEVARKYCKHPGCIVPSGIIKAIEVACGLALPQTAEIRFE